MIDASEPISVGFSELLAGLTYKAKPVLLFDIIADDKARTPYVILGPWLGRKDNTKDSFGQTGEITLDINTRFTGGEFSKKPANDIASLITLMISPRPGASVLNVTGFSCWNLTVGPSQELTMNSASDIVFRKLLTINLSLRQL